MILDDCPLDSSYQDVGQWAACLRKAAGPAISSINPSDPAYMHVHTAGANPWVWVLIGIGSLIFCIWLTGYALHLAGATAATPKVKLNPMRPRTGQYASTVTKDGTVWARTKPASMGGQ